jgi:hypothetical protein
MTSHFVQLNKDNTVAAAQELYKDGIIRHACHCMIYARTPDGKVEDESTCPALVMVN